MVRHISLAGLLVILLVGVVGCSQGTSKETIALREEVDVLKKEVLDLQKISDLHQKLMLLEGERVTFLADRVFEITAVAGITKSLESDKTQGHSPSILE